MFSRPQSLLAYVGTAFAVSVCGCLLVLIAVTSGNIRTISLVGFAVSAMLGVMQWVISTQWMKAREDFARVQERATLAEQESNAKSTVIGTISHDLRTQLNAIIGFADVLAKGAFGPLGSPRYEEYAANIRASGQTLLGVVNDLSQLTQLSTLEGEIICQPIDVGTTASKAAAQLHPNAAEKNITLKIDVLPRPIWGFAQREALRQIVSRLIDNSIKFTGEGGMIVLSVAEGKHHVDIMVTDNGPGIPPEQLKSFKHPPRDGNSGTGLGLVVSRRLAERMNGKLIIESIPGRGTRVTIRLREAESEAAPRVEPTAAIGFIDRDPFRAVGQRNPFNAAA